VQVAKNALVLCHTALPNALPNARIVSSNYVLNTWIALEGGAGAAEAILSRYSRPAEPIDASAWGALICRNGLRLLSRNDAEGWALTVFGDPSLVQGTHLFLSIDFNFVRESLTQIEQQIENIENKLRVMLKTLGINLPDGTNASR
jgi:hypothetical protein